MAWNPTSPVTGGTITGFTSPTYTLSTDYAPDASTGKQWAVTALGGTQASVRTHSATDPFTVSFFRPKVFKSPGQPNPVTGAISSVPFNVFKQIVRKGVLPAANQAARPMRVTTSFEVPAGADTYDAANVKAAVSLFVGVSNQQSAGIADTLISGLS